MTVIDEFGQEITEAKTLPNGAMIEPHEIVNQVTIPDTLRSPDAMLARIKELETAVPVASFRSNYVTFTEVGQSMRAIYIGIATSRSTRSEGEMYESAQFISVIDGVARQWSQAGVTLMDQVKSLEPNTMVEITLVEQRRNKKSVGTTNVFDVVVLGPSSGGAPMFQQQTQTQTPPKPSAQKAAFNTASAPKPSTPANNPKPEVDNTPLGVMKRAKAFYGQAIRKGDGLYDANGEVVPVARLEAARKLMVNAANEVEMPGLADEIAGSAHVDIPIKVGSWFRAIESATKPNEEIPF